jgi:hypothetical protein
MLTFVAYGRWQWKRAPWGAAAFVGVAWCWFQIDYGTVWPVLGVLFLDALLAQGTRRFWEPLLTGLALAATIAPFAYYYELWSRLSVQGRSWGDRFKINLFNINQYVVPILVLVLAVLLLALRRQKFPAIERRLIAIGCLLPIVFMFWIPSIAPEVFLRYLIPAMPVGALLSAWVLVRGVGSWRPHALAGAGTAVLAITPLLSLPLNPFVSRPPWIPPDAGIRPELSVMTSQIFRHSVDPNRIVVEWLKRNAVRTDEILINYEDIPLMFYLPNPIRGGIAAFRAEDDARTPARFVILRGVSFAHWPVYRRVVQRYRWTQIPTKAPDIPWGNNPDPSAQAQDPALAQPLLIARREGR